MSDIEMPTNDAALINRLLSTQPSPAECLIAAARIEQLTAAAILALPLEADRAALLREAMKLPEVQAMRTALQTLRDLMCEGFEDDDGNSGCGLCENDCTGCIADRALKGSA